MDEQRRLHTSTPHQNKAHQSLAGRFVPPSYAKITRTSTQAKKETHLFSVGALRQNASTWPRRKRACPLNYEEGRRINKAPTPWLVRVPGRPNWSLRNDVSFSFPTLRGPPHHIRALDATKNAGYPNLDANNPSATAHEYPCPQTVFARVLRHTVGGDFSGIRTGAPLTGLCIQDTICLTRTCWRKRGSGTATGFTQLARPTRHPLDMAPRVLWGTRRSPAACRLRGARRPRVGGNHVVWL